MSRKKIVRAIARSLIGSLVAVVTAFGAPFQEEPLTPGVSGTIDGKQYAWEVPDPDSESCSIYGRTFRVSFHAADESSTIIMGGSVVRVTLPDGNGYVATRDPLNPSAFRNAISIEDNTVSYSGKLQFGPLERTPGSKVIEVEATITARCP